eukprot:5306563-Amphidinium_carterae.1
MRSGCQRSWIAESLCQRLYAFSVVPTISKQTKPWHPPCQALNLEPLRAKGLQPGETELPDSGGSSSAAPTPAAPNEMVIEQLIMMGAHFCIKHEPVCNGWVV